MAARAKDDPVFDAWSLTSTPLTPRVVKSTDRDDVVTEQVMFHSEREGNTNFDMFAYFSYLLARGLPA
jgi:hypothetical protein